VHENIRDHQCDICGKWFKQKPHVSGHRATHFDGKPYACDECGKAFKRRNELVYMGTRYYTEFLKVEKREKRLFQVVPPAVHAHLSPSQNLHPQM
jgi:hypothetical protein